MSPIEYTVERSIRRKHTYITVQNDGSVLVKASLHSSSKVIEAFVQQKREWILKHQQKIKATLLQEKDFFYFLGEQKERQSYSHEMIEKLYRQKAKEIIPPLVETYSRKMQLYPTKISFRKAKTRWGSCSAKNSLSFNIHLMQTPLPFIEYVVVHELAHIRYKNHSKAFWSLVEEILPDYKERQTLIKNRHFIL